MNETILGISGFLSLITLIVFFVMANNISSIKDYIKTSGKKDWYQEYTKRKFMKRSDAEILFAAQEFIWNEIISDRSLKKYDALKATWSAKFISLGGEFPEYPFKA